MSKDEDQPSKLSEVVSVLDEDKETNMWRVMFEEQNKNMQALIAAFQSSKSTYHEELPSFDPEKPDTDAKSWCATADLCFAKNPPIGSGLVLAVSKALKGEASTWLSQIAYEGMTWNEFKVLFTTRFISTETLAGTLIKLNDEKPSEKESLPAFTGRLISLLINQWKDVNKEEIAVATVLAHLSQFDLRIQRMAFTTNISSRDKLQQELNAFSHLKRKLITTNESFDGNNVKQARITSVQCFNCGKIGHKKNECRNQRIETRERPQRFTFSANQSTKLLVCYKCGRPGHIAVRCTSSGGSGPAEDAPRGVQRVDVCLVPPPSNTLERKDKLSLEDVCKQVDRVRVNNIWDPSAVSRRR